MKVRVYREPEIVMQQSNFYCEARRERPLGPAKAQTGLTEVTQTITKTYPVKRFQRQVAGKRPDVCFVVIMDPVLDEIVMSNNSDYWRAAYEQLVTQLRSAGFWQRLVYLLKRWLP